MLNPEAVPDRLAGLVTVSAIAVAPLPVPSPEIVMVWLAVSFDVSGFPLASLVAPAAVPVVLFVIVPVKALVTWGRVSVALGLVGFPLASLVAPAAVPVVLFVIVPVKALVTWGRVSVAAEPRVW